MIVSNPPQSLTDNLLMLGTREYPLYLFRDAGEALVFEGGVGACGPVLAGQLDQLGVDKASVRQLVVTHAHPDHVMAVPALRAMFPGVQVLASQAAAATMGNEKAIGFFCKIDQALTESLLKAGSIGESHRPQPPTELKIPVDRVLNEGDTLTVGGAAFTVLATPGHSDCSLSFYEPARKVLVVSDATGYYLNSPDPLWWPNYFTDYGAYVESIRRLAALDAEVLCLSHNAAIVGADDVEAYFAGCLEATEAYHRRIVDAVKAGQDGRELAGQLGAEIHARAGLLGVEFFQKNCGLLVKLSMAYENTENTNSTK